MDPTLCREHLERLLREEAETLLRLEPILEREHTLLLGKDIAGLERAGLERQELVGRLLRIEEERRSLCSMHGRSADAAGLERLIAWCDPARTLRARFEETARRAAQCRSLNERNGALVGARLRRVGQMLEMLTGSRGAGRTYDSQGRADSAAVGRVVQLRA